MLHQAEQQPFPNSQKGTTWPNKGLTSLVRVMIEMFVSPPNSHVEALFLNVMVFRLRRDHEKSPP